MNTRFRNNLRNGNFEEVNIEEWFKEYRFGDIFCTLEGLNKNIRFDILDEIVANALDILNNPKVTGINKKELLKVIKDSGLVLHGVEKMSLKDMKNYWEKRLVEYCEVILQEVIILCSKHMDDYSIVAEKLSNYDNEKIRTYCACNFDYNRFIDDESLSVKKVVNIRRNFDDIWNNLNTLEQDRILFIVDALNSNEINIWDGNIEYLEKDKVCVKVVSNLFTCGAWLRKYDKNVVYSMRDKRILAYDIYNLILSEKLRFKDEFKPDCFSDGFSLIQKK